MFMEILKSLAQLPGLLLIVLLLALVLWFRLRSLAWLLVLFTFVSLYLLSTRPVANWLMAGLERYPVFSQSNISPQRDALVILGTGVQGNTPEYGMEPQPGPLLTQRLRYGARLAKQTGLDVLVSGGTVYEINEAKVMAGYLASVGVSVRWQEGTSLSTRDNAFNSASILHKQGIHRVVLVTHSWHMPRAVGLFQKAGLSVVAAPTASAIGLPLKDSYRNWLPNMRWLRNSQLALVEYVAMARDRFY